MGYYANHGLEDSEDLGHFESVLAMEEQRVNERMMDLYECNCRNMPGGRHWHDCPYFLFRYRNRPLVLEDAPRRTSKRDYNIYYPEERELERSGKYPISENG